MFFKIDKDQSKNVFLKAVVYTCALAGGLIAAIAAPVGSGVAMTAAYTAGGVALGGLGGPLAITTLALCGYGLYRIGKTVFKTCRDEAAIIPVAYAVVGYSSFRSLTSEPLHHIKSLFKKSAQKQTSPTNKTAPSSEKLLYNLSDKILKRKNP